jgi:oxygen-independent coproporphyrinogen III oxidase
MKMPMSQSHNENPVTTALQKECYKAPANPGCPRYLPWVTETPEASLYVHVPFCAHKCEYCAFYSHAPGDLMQRYVDALLREARMLPELKPRTIFFGGGTPSLLSLKQWEQIGWAFHELGWSSPQEWTVECNPATVSADKARLFRELGVNRVSMGVQSFDERLLERLGRIHSREQVFKSYDILRQAGFGSVNIDLMFAIPTQTMEAWRATLDEAMALQTEHLSCYEVIYEQDTPLFAQLQAGQFDVDEDLACEMYDALVSTAAANGFAQYEIANFAKDAGIGNDVPSFACKHNVNYWRGGLYYALGPSAAGYEPQPGGALGVRTRNWANTQMYCEVVERGQRPFESREALAPLARAGEVAAFGLRMNAGWPFDSFLKATGFDLRDEWSGDMRKLAEDGLAFLETDRFRLTSRGLRLADMAAQEFLRS